MTISNKVRQTISGSSFIRKMFEEGDRLRKIYGPDKVYDFSLGNPDLEPPDAFNEAFARLANHPIPGMHRYMNNAGYVESRKAVADLWNAKSGLELNENHVIMTVGAGGGLNVIFKALFDPGVEVIVTAPYFVEYGFYADNHQGRLIPVTAAPGFQLDVKAIAAAINDRTKAIIINSPNNPTGVIYREEILKELAALLHQKEAELGTIIYLISDEPYSGLAYDGIKVPPVLRIF